MAETPPIDAATRDRLARGETTTSTQSEPGSPNPRLIVRRVLDVAPPQVWAVIEDIDRYAEFMPRVKVSRVVGREDGGVILSHSEVAMPFPLRNLKAEIRGVHTVVEGERWERRWRMISGDYKRNEGGWLLTPFEGDAARTLLEYQILVVPNIPIPKKIANAVQERAMPEMMDCLRKRVLSLA